MLSYFYFLPLISASSFCDICDESIAQQTRQTTPVIRIEAKSIAKTSINLEINVNPSDKK